MLQEFKKFLMRGNVVELAVGLVIGAAFTAVVTSFVNDLLMPPIGLLLGRVSFTDLFVSLDGRAFPSLAAAKAAGAPTLNYGAFVTTIINFVIVAFAVFLVVRAVNRLAAPKPAPAAPATTRECPYCASTIPLRAVRCPHCTSEIRPGAA
jgi:large conductance mechanosensitive channel